MSSAEKISEEVLHLVLAAAGVLDTFHRIPEADQEHFARWINNARDEESRSRRMDALALALRIGPLRDEVPEEWESATESTV